ncbi:MAG TPA: flagellar export chaperone FlgN [Rhodocyclaceae bacterium]|nr:flagellar export chaperone FlgN [Rhodocyclaceae bacterium]
MSTQQGGQQGREQALQRLALGVQADLNDYGSLQVLLQTQFEAALRHQTAGLAQVADEITALCQILQARRLERVTLVAQCAELARDASPQEKVEALLAHLPSAYRGAAQAIWHKLQALVHECKALNVRNCTLLMDQHEIMQRVLNDESDIYVPL